MFRQIRRHKPLHPAVGFPDTTYLPSENGVMPPIQLPLGAPAAADQPLVLVLLVLLCAAAVIAVACRKFNVEAIPGYLLAGALVGPHALGLITSERAAQPVTDLATVLLLFTIGLQFDTGNFRRGALSIVALSVASTALYIALFWVVLLGIGLPAPVALALSMAGCSASTAVTLRLLQHRRELHEAHGRVSMGFSILDDLSGVVMLAAFPLIAAWAGASGAEVASSGITDKLLAAGKAVGGTALMLAVAGLLLPRVMLQVARLHSQETLLLSTAAIALLSAAWTSWIGFSPEMGAFLAGVMLGGTPLRYQLVGQLGPTRDLLMAVFFLSVGLVVDPALVGRNLPMVLGLAAALMAIKLAVTAGCCWAAGMTGRGSILTGVYNINAGEFTFVLLASATGLAIISAQQAALSVAVAAITLISTPLLVGPAHVLSARLSRLPLAPWVRSSALQDPAPSAPGSESPLPAGSSEAGPVAESGTTSDEGASGHVIIAGFGPGGRAVAARLAVLSLPYVIVELNASTVQRLAGSGRRVIFGDISNTDVLEAAGVAHAIGVIITIPDDDAALRAVQAVRQAAPDVFIGVRTQFLAGKMQALALGANEVVVAEVAVAKAMDGELISALSRRLDCGSQRAHPDNQSQGRSGIFDAPT